MSVSYNDFISAIESYYVPKEGYTPKYTWEQVSNTLSKYNINQSNYINYLEDYPELFNVIKNKNGTILSTNLNSPVQYDDITKTWKYDTNYNFNSNTIPSTVNSSAILEVPAIANTATTGEFTLSSGIGLKASTGTTVTGIARTIGVGVGAVALGAQIGKVIGKALYEGNPDTWDEGLISGLSNEDWSKFAISLKDQVQEGILGLFGVNGDETTMYLDENFAAYMAWYMYQNGLLNESKSVSIKDTSGLSQSTIDLLPLKLSTPSPTIVRYRDGKLTNEFTFKSESNLSAYLQFNELGKLYTYTWYGTERFNNIRYENEKENGNYFSSKVGDVNNKPIWASKYTCDIFSENSYELPITPYNIIPPTPSQEIGYVILYGDVTTESDVNGITNNPNSTQFNPTGIGSVSTALEALKNQYPELWDNAIKTKVPQEDGTEDERTYIPLPIPNFKDAYDKQPTTGTPSQSNPSIKPDTTPDDELDNTANTIAPPQTPSQDDNTGSGDTPSIITPTQQASALWAIYNPTLGELNSLGAWLWSSNFIDQLLKIFNDPMQAIIGLHKVYATPQISGTGNIKVGYLDSGVSSNIVGNQYTYIDCGTVSLREYYGNVLDYSPYTDIKLYLPFIGIVPLDIADVSRASINVKYGVDVLTGACLASVSVYRDNAGGVLYQYSGNCACQYPLSSGSYMGMVTGAIGALGSLARGSVVGAMMGVAGMHTNIEHSGGFSGNAGAMGIKKPYLIISRPQSQMNDAFPSIQGYPSNHYTILNNCSGFTQVKDCHVENINATDYELQQIKKLLLEGVII